MASTRSPALMRSAVSCWPTSNPLASSRRNSTRCRPGSTPAAVKWPCSGLFSDEGRRTPQVTWSAEYPSRSAVLTWTTRRGAIFRTVTGMARLFSSQTWVMPTFSPTIALVATVDGSLPSSCWSGRHVAARLVWFFGAVTGARFACQRSAREDPSGALARFCPEVPTWNAGRRSETSIRPYWAEIGPTCDVTPWVQGPARRISPLEPGEAGSDVLDLDLDVDAGRQVQALQGVHGLRGVLHDVDQPLVHLHLEVLATVFVLVG